MAKKVSTVDEEQKNGTNDTTKKEPKTTATKTATASRQGTKSAQSGISTTTAKKATTTKKNTTAKSKVDVEEVVADTETVTETNVDEKVEIEPTIITTFEEVQPKKEVEETTKSEGEIIVNEKDNKIPLVATNPNKQLKKLKTLKKRKKKNPNIVRFDVNIDEGLNEEQVNQRIEEGQINVPTKTNNKTILQIILSNTFTYFNTLCFVIAGVLLSIYISNGILRENIANLFFIIIIMCNLFIGIIQEVKAKLMVDKIKLMTSPSATVIRSGKQREIPISEIVLDDIIELYAGKQVPADAIMVDGIIEVNESMLTGESVPVRKQKGDELYGGSVVISGKARVFINKVGDDCYNALIASKAKTYKKPDSQLLKTMNTLTKIVGVLIIPLSILTMIDMIIELNSEANISVFSTEGVAYVWSQLPNIMTRFAASIIGVIPAGMFLLTSMALAVGVINLAKKKTLVHDLYSIEMLARVDVLCLDKTGTITDGSMKVNQVIMVDPTYNLKIRGIIGSMLKELNGTNQTSVALADFFGYKNTFKKKAMIPFSSARKYSAVTFTDNDGTFVIGAHDYNPGLKVVMDAQTKRVVDEDIMHLQEKGYRVVMFSRASADIREISEDKVMSFPEGTEIRPIAFIIIEEHIRENARDIIETFQRNGVQIKVISGDNEFTVREISESVGLENTKCIKLQGRSDEEVIKAAKEYNVFGRVTPEQKCLLVKSLKSEGHRVAMTGDGVNDILALKEADCSITIKSGSEAARNVSNLVLLGDDFTPLPSVVSEGRRVINNVQNSASLFLVKTLFVTLITIFFILVPNASFPFEPRNFLMIELFVSGLPSFFLALQKNNGVIKGNFMANLMARVVPGGLIMFLNVLLCYIINSLLERIPALSVRPEYLIWMCCLTLTFTGAIILYVTCKPANLYRSILLFCDLGAMLFVIFVLPSVANMIPMFTALDLGFELFDLFDVTQLVYALTTVIVVVATFSTYKVLLEGCEKLKNIITKEHD